MLRFLCWLQGSYPGTLFRFPLRSDSTAAVSNIKAQPTTPQQALQLLQSLTDVLPQALLFLKSLQEIEVYVVGEPDTATEQGQQLAAAGGLPGAAEQLGLLFRANLRPLDGGCHTGVSWSTPFVGSRVELLSHVCCLPEGFMHTSVCRGYTGYTTALMGMPVHDAVGCFCVMRYAAVCCLSLQARMPSRAASHTLSHQGVAAAARSS